MADERFYYVTHPSVGLTATVYAPDTEKARTVYLDYLERTGQIRRNVRSILRGNIVAQKMEHEDMMPTDVTLDYTHAAQGTSMSVPRISTGEFLDTVESEEEERLVEPVTVQQPRQRSRLEEAALGRYA